MTNNDDIRLFIADQEIEFSEPLHLFFNYKIEDTTSPTKVKNSYTKTLKVKGTDKNNQVFANLWDVRRYGAEFDPSRKNPFKLFRNGEMEESGYVKLLNILHKGNEIEYSLTLFGGLGDFFLNLAEKGEDGEKKTLADLEYTSQGGDNEFDFIVNKESVYEAWKRLGMGIDNSASLWSTINFAPAYNGIPENWETGNMMCEMDDNPFMQNAQPSGPSGVNGYFLAKVGNGEKEYTEWQARDLRAYMQRPVLRVKSLITAMTDPRNNGGYEVELDKAFFNKSNPYWNDTWMTLPLIKDTEIAKKDTTLENIELPVRHILPARIKIPLADIPKTFKSGAVGTLDFTFSMEMGVPYLDDLMLTSCSQADGKYYDAWYTVQLVAKDRNGYYKGGSDIAALTSTNTQAYIAGMGQQPEVPAYYRAYKGNFNFNNYWVGYTWYYRFDQDVSLTLSNIQLEEGMTFEVQIQKVFETNLPAGRYKDNTAFTAWKKTKNPIIDNMTTGDMRLVKKSLTFTLTTGREDQFTKKRMLSTEDTPLDYLLSYTKMFGLMYVKDPSRKHIKILSRNSYYSYGVADLSDKIDYSKDFLITPLSFDKKWYDFELKNEDSWPAEKYQKSYELPFGIQRVNTNYSFDRGKKNLLEKNVYKGAVMLREKSRMNVNAKAWWLTDNRKMPPFIIDGVQTYVYTPDYEQLQGDTVQQPIADNTFLSLYVQQDYFPFPMMCFADKDNSPVDGSNVLCFYNSSKGTYDYQGNRYYLSITDDIPEVTKLSGDKKCWIMAPSKSIDVDTLPQFSRYKTNGLNVTHSLNMGLPQETYTYDYAFNDTSSVYAKYWQSFIRDQYDANTRVLECYVKFDGKIMPDYVRNLFYFEDSYWALLEIKDYDLCNQQPCKCKFIKIQNPEAYRTGQSL